MLLLRNNNKKIVLKISFAKVNSCHILLPCRIPCSRTQTRSCTGKQNIWNIWQFMIENFKREQTWSFVKCIFRSARNTSRDTQTHLETHRTPTVIPGTLPVTLVTPPTTLGTLLDTSWKTPETSGTPPEHPMSLIPVPHVYDHCILLRTNLFLI